MLLCNYSWKSYQDAVTTAVHSQRKSQAVICSVTAANASVASSKLSNIHVSHGMAFELPNIAHCVKRVARVMPWFPHIHCIPLLLQGGHLVVSLQRC